MGAASAAAARGRSAVNRWRWLLLACGVVVFVVDVREDMQVYDLAVALGWTTEGVRMVVGHGLRELLPGH